MKTVAMRNLKKFEELINTIKITADTKFLKGKNLDYKSIKPEAEKCGLNDLDINTTAIKAGLTLINVPKTPEEKSRKSAANKKKNVDK